MRRSVHRDPEQDPQAYVEVCDAGHGECRRCHVEVGSGSCDECIAERESNPQPACIYCGQPMQHGSRLRACRA